MNTKHLPITRIMGSYRLICLRHGSGINYQSSGTCFRVAASLEAAPTWGLHNLNCLQIPTPKS